MDTREDPLFSELRKAIAKGWTTPENSSKEMDVILAQAIQVFVYKLVKEWCDEEYKRGLRYNQEEHDKELEYAYEDGKRQGYAEGHNDAREV